MDAQVELWHKKPKIRASVEKHMRRWELVEEPRMPNKALDKFPSPHVGSYIVLYLVFHPIIQLKYLSQYSQQD